MMMMMMMMNCVTLQGEKMPVETLQSAANSLVCVDSDSSASSMYQLFHTSLTSSSLSSSSAAAAAAAAALDVSSAVRFLSSQCQRATQLCEECLSRQHCLTSGELFTFITYVILSSASAAGRCVIISIVEFIFRVFYYVSP